MGDITEQKIICLSSARTVKKVDGIPALIKVCFVTICAMLPKLQQVPFLRCVGSREVTLVMWIEDQILMAVR
jgi:hypothetical protein